MALRYLEARLPAEVHDEAEALLQDHAVIDASCVPTGDVELHRFLLESQDVEGIVDALRSRFGDDVRMVIMPVEATLPREPEPEPEPAPGEPEVPVPEPTKRPPARISREELLEDIGERIQLTPAFLVLAGVSAIVASLGLVRDDQVALIGAMVIAPLLGPNVALALSTTLVDLDLARRALRSGLLGISLSFLVALGLGAVLPVDPEGAEILARSEPDLGHLALALASGIAGGLAFTTGLPASLIGVMVAVALLPPLATGGLLLGAGHTTQSLGAFLLLGINLIAVNLAGVGTFLVQGVRPVWVWEASKARRAARRAIALWALLLAALVVAMLYARGTL